MPVASRCVLGTTRFAMNLSNRHTAVANVLFASQSCAKRGALRRAYLGLPTATFHRAHHRQHCLLPVGPPDILLMIQYMLTGDRTGLKYRSASRSASSQVGAH